VTADGRPDPLGAETDSDPTEVVASTAPAATGVLPVTGDGSTGDVSTDDVSTGGGEPSAETEPDTDGDDTGRKRGRRSTKPAKSTRRVVLEWLALIASALIIAFLIKTFLFQAFYIPSESMVPTLEVGDRVLVNKLSYDFHDVHRGDIVVFDAPALARSNDIKDLVKRVIGLPGETVTYPGDGHIYIDGHLLKEPYLPKGTQTDQDASNPKVPPGCATPADGHPGCKVPAGHIFVMGDNRTASKDARFFGPISESSIVGRVFLRIWPLDSIGFM
jgi:signal peptidase I